ncbi:MAG: NAD(P)(+) transhydrogenase (Re/Si-specific) subunit alpha, partial [Bacillota bacterium]
MQFEGITFGVTKEIMRGERRVAATPETVSKFVQGGARVLVEKGAGEGAYFTDEEYKEAGAEIIEDVENLFEQADVILKGKEPLINEKIGTHE